MDITFSYDIEFENLINLLKTKYGNEIFELEGIGSQLDLCAYSQNYYKTHTTTSDISVDANANVEEQSVIAYDVESPKPLKRLNSLFLIWKYTKQYYNKEVADRIVEQQISGDYYINDMTGIQSCYSYFGGTVLNVKYNGNHLNIPMDNLYNMLEHNEIINDDYKEILNFDKVDEFNNCIKGDLEVLDTDNKWVKISRLLKHKKHNKLMVVTCKNGLTTIVTEDHPIILDNDTTKTPNELNIGVDKLKHDEKIKLEFNNKIIGNNKFGYYIGFFCGDGHYHKDVNSGSHILEITQKDIENSKILQIANDLELKPNIKHNYKYRSCGRFSVYNKKLYEKVVNEYRIFHRSQYKNIPCNIFDYNKEFAGALIAGIIDSDGTINPNNGMISIRVISFGMCQQIQDVLRAFGIDSTVRCTKTPNASTNTYRQQHELTNISFRLNSDNIKYFSLSEKVLRDKDLVLVEKGKYLKFDDYTVESVREVTGKTKDIYDGYVYDITTETGHFYSQGLIQHNCFNYSTLDVMEKGLPFVSKIKSEPPKHLSSFLGQVIHFSVYASNSILGACGLADLLIVSSYYVDKLFNDNPNIPKDFLWKQVKQELQSFIFACNQPFRGGIQSGFYNVSVYDDYFLDELCNDYYFPNEKFANKETIKILQEMYIDLINETLERSPLTFPVTTACFAIDENNIIKDQEFVKFIARKNKKYGFINIYSGKTSTLSSCCFDGSQKTLTKSSVGGVKLLSFQDLYNTDYDEAKKNFTVFHNGSWVKSKVIKTNPRALYKIITMNNKELLITDNHINATLKGDKETTSLTLDDYLLFNTMALDTFSEKDLNLTYEQGLLVGMYLGDGSVEIKENHTPTIHLSLNESKYNLSFESLKKAISSLNIDSNIIRLSTPYNNVYPLNIRNKIVYDFIKEWVIGNYSYEKQLNLNCLLQSKEFRKGILDGFYLTDGGNSNRIYTTSSKLSEEIECLITSLGYCSTITISDRTDEKVIIRNKEYNRNYPLYCIRWYDSGNKRTMKDIYIVQNNSIYFKIKSIELLPYSNDDKYCFEIKNQDEPYFTLPNGIITHNCRLRSEKDTEYFNQFGAGGTKIGSLGVVTINLPRLAIRANKDKDIFFEELNLKVSDAIKINAVKRNVLRKRIDNGNQPLYTLGFMDLTKQYATIGLNGINEMVELMGYDILKDDGQKFVVEVLDYINNLNDKATKKYKAPHNTEQTPSESSAVKLAKKDKLLKYQNKYDLYSNQFIPLTVNADMLDRIYLQGLFDSKMSGGSICHINVETEINDESQIVDLINYCAKNGVIYWAINYNLQKCINGHLTVGKNINCNICGGKITDNYTRTVGFLTNVKNWNKTRREVDYPNRIFYDNIKR